LMVVGEFVFPSSSLQKRKEKGSTNWQGNKAMR
jgi:hypothetical protein